MRFLPTRIDLFKELPPDAEGAEIGVQAGLFSQEILATNSIKRLHLVDCWQHQKGAYENDPANIPQAHQDYLFSGVVQRFGKLPNVTIHREWSIDAAKKLPMLDWVYLDADHTYKGAVTDLLQYSWIIKPGGCIMGHDFIDNGKSRKMGFEVIRAVNVFCDVLGWTIDALTEEEWSSYKLVRA